MSDSTHCQSHNQGSRHQPSYHQSATRQVNELEPNQPALLTVASLPLSIIPRHSKQPLTGLQLTFYRLLYHCPNLTYHRLAKHQHGKTNISLLDNFFFPSNNPQPVHKTPRLSTLTRASYNRYRTVPNSAYQHSKTFVIPSLQSLHFCAILDPSSHCCSRVMRPQTNARLGLDPHTMLINVCSLVTEKLHHKMCTESTL